MQAQGNGSQSFLFPFMGQALLFALEKFLDHKLKPEYIEAWEDVYDPISNEIVKGILS
jgi:hemoglobin-like flavoprotein